MTGTAQQTWLPPCCGGTDAQMWRHRCTDVEMMQDDTGMMEGGVLGESRFEKCASEDRSRVGMQGRDAG